MSAADWEITILCFQTRPECESSIQIWAALWGLRLPERVISVYFLACFAYIDSLCMNQWQAWCFPRLSAFNRSSARKRHHFWVPCDFPKVSLHINALMHSANRAAIPIAPAVMHCRYEKWAHFPGVGGELIIRFLIRFSVSLARSPPSWFVCLSETPDAPEWAFSLLFSSRADTGLRAQ